LLKALAYIEISLRIEVSINVGAFLGNGQNKDS
jgi:hypothetical protein